MILSVSAMQAGECLYAKTPTAEYWMILMGHQIASVYRRGNGGEVKSLGDRKLSNQVVQGEPFQMFDRNNDPVSVIQVVECKKVRSDTIPFERG